MCGIVGFVSESVNKADFAAVQHMLDRVLHRGPDDTGLFTSPSGLCVLGHSRLAILDLSPSGHQPMSSADGRYTIVFNGEIYNFRDLRFELEQDGWRFHGQSDTEVILALYQKFGDDCVRKLEGMFAFGIWDEAERCLFLARDPLGIKPLYVWAVGATLAFASEIRSVLAADLAPKQLDPVVAFQYFRLGSVPEPGTLVQGVRMLTAGSSQHWKQGQLLRAAKYWSLSFSGVIDSAEEARTAVRQALNAAIERHFVSDVPVGLFLSGGLDSTAILAIAHGLGHRDLRSFCISFEDEEFDEGSLARRTAAHFGCRHTDWKMSAQEGRALAGSFLESMDQPTSDGFNTFCVSRLASQQGMKVVLSGLGGDELFAGYPSFERIPEILRLRKLLSRTGLAGLAACGIRAVSGQPRWRRLAGFLSGSGSVSEAWFAMRGFFDLSEAQQLVRHISGQAPGAGMTALQAGFGEESDSVADQISAMEIEWYMRNQLLRDSDVMSMKWGLELRVPFVDSRLIETLTQISSRLRLAKGKRLLREAIPEIPEWILAQPKRGFRFPFELWAEDCWKEWFDRIECGSPVSCRNWYRRCCLIALQHFLDANQVSYGGRRFDGMGA
jgi:asparagine synthase (glutamine-hydrolysing)